MEAAVEVFCSRTVIFFDISQIQDVCLMHNVLSNRQARRCTLFHGGRPPAGAGTDGACPHGPNRLCSVSDGFPDICTRNARFFQGGRLHPGILQTTTAIITDKNEKAAHPERKRQEVHRKKRDKKNRPDLVPEIFAQQPSFTDPQGSWTGLPMNEHEIPVQDADDL